MEALFDFYVEFLKFLRILPLWVVYSYVFLIGAIIGSFLNVCIYRLPLKLSIVTPRSSCPGCKRKIPWYHNIPILSYLWLRGRCAYCGTKISAVYPFVELLTAVYFVLLMYFYGPYVLFPIYALFGCLMIILIFVDYYHRLLPAVITFPGVVLGFLCSFINPYLNPVQSAMGIVIGALLPLTVYLAYKYIRKIEALGHGDIVMLAMVGAFLGWKMVFVVILFSSVFGAVLGLLFILLFRKQTDYLLPFGTFIGAVALITVFFGHYVWNLYFLR